MRNIRILKTLSAAVLFIPLIWLALPNLTSMLVQSSYERAYTGFGITWAYSALQAAEVKKSEQKWTCPMHPHYIADEFGSCPICGMDLVKIQSSSTEEPAKDMGQATNIIIIPAQTIQNMGVRIAKVEASRFGRQIRSYGIVKENERLRSELSARVEGWIEKLKVTAVGDQVQAGDILFELFSPELIVSQRDYLTALKQGKQSRKNITRRLLNFGVQRQALDLLAKKGTVMQSLPFYAEQSGTISELNVASGSYVKRGMTIGKIQDFSEVWVMVNVSEKNMSFISKNTAATIYFPNLPGKEIAGHVDYIYPQVDAKTRTGQVRIVVDNKAGELRPGTYADVVFDTTVEERLSVPAEAILKDESGDYVVVALGEGRFSSTQVKVGLVSGGRAEIISGIDKGDDIVVSAQFLIDSESALRESFRKLERLQLPLSQLTLTKDQFAMFDHLVDGALYLHETIRDGTGSDPKQLDPALSIKQLLWPTFKDTRLASVLTDAEVAIKRAQAAKTQSETKEALADLVTALEPWLLIGAPDHYKARGLVLFQTKDGGKKWLQTNATSANPFNDQPASSLPWPDKKIQDPDEMPAQMKIPDSADTDAIKPRGGAHVH